MPDYEPLDLGQVCNVGLEVLGDSAGKPPLGKVELRGLPFVIGTESPDREHCFVVPDAPTSIPVGRAVRRVIFAHRQLEPAGQSWHGVGTVVAEYVFHHADGTSVSVPIRERFETQVVPTEWGQFPFLAVPDTENGKLPRFEGRWGETGFRLAEHYLGRPAGYYLWCWENPSPGATLERIEIVPRGPGLLLAGITLGDADEHPFVRTPGQPVRLTVTDPEVGARPGVLDAEVDRGTVTYPQPVADEPERAGWGTPNPDSASPAYASVAALPSATLSVSHDGEPIGDVNWGEVEREGKAESEHLRVELVESGRNWVHVSVLDDATGKPVPCRVHFRSPEGVPYQPHGHHQHVNQNLGSWHLDVGGDVRLGRTTYAYIDGTCQGWLPRGEVVVEVARGFEYEPLNETARIEPGQRELTLRIGRVADTAADGWWSGDSHVHFLSTAGAQLEQLGEDLRIVNLLQAQWGALFTNTEDFSGRPSLVDHAGDYITYVGQENRQHLLGHLILWGLKQPVMPWGSDGPDEGELGGALETTLSDWADRTHAQGGTVVAPHFPNPNGEPAVLITTGRADAVEMLAHNQATLLEYYRYLNCGYRLPIVGGTDKMSNSVPVGIYRTYARLDDEELTYDGWCRAVRAGKTYLSGGPLLSLSVDGRQPGDTVELSGSGTVTAEASVTSIFPLRSLELVRNGQVVAVAEGNGARQLALREELKVDGHAWIACRAYGLDHHLDEWGRQVFAHTSPVYVACGGPWGMIDPTGMDYLRTLVEGAREYVRQTAVRRADHRTTHHHGEADHLAWLERPFDEALRALDERTR